MTELNQKILDELIGKWVEEQSLTDVIRENLKKDRMKKFSAIEDNFNKTKNHYISLLRNPGMKNISTNAYWLVALELFWEKVFTYIHPEQLTFDDKILDWFYDVLADGDIGDYLVHEWSENDCYDFSSQADSFIEALINREVY